MDAVPRETKVEVASRRFPPNDEVAIFNPYEEVETTEANLPHWRQRGATYFVTFRLVDSLPAEKLVQWQHERELWLAHHPFPHTPEEQAQYLQRFSARLDDWLDQGSGSCVLVLPDCRAIVERALQHFAGERYDLGEFVVAANHVHVLVMPRAGHDLSDNLHSWKSFTAKQITKVETASRRLADYWESRHERRVLVARQAFRADEQIVMQRPVWQKESYDHLVRSQTSLRRIEEYIRAHRAAKKSGGTPD